jgi:(2R)-ethylmalonyl-CoA mutase
VRLVMRGEHPAPLEELRARVKRLAAKLGVTPKFLVGKPGLDGHSNGAEQIAVRAADCGLEVIYEGIRLTPDQIVTAAKEHGVHLIGLSILSGSHVPLIRDVMHRLRAAGLGHVPVVAGGIIPAEDVHVLKQLGVAAVYTPKDFELNRMMGELVGLMEKKAIEQSSPVTPANAGAH